MGRPPGQADRCGARHPDRDLTCTRPRGHHGHHRARVGVVDTKWVPDDLRAPVDAPCGAPHPRRRLRCTRPKGHKGQHRNQRMGDIKWLPRKRRGRLPWA